MLQHYPLKSYEYLKCAPSSNQMHRNPSLHVRLTFISCKTSSLVYSDIFAVMDTHLDDVPISYIFQNIPLLVMYSML
jgi:hypothetical protein